MNSLERIFTVSLAGAVFSAVAVLLALIVGTSNSFWASPFVLFLAGAVTFLAIVPVVSLIEIVGKLLSARRSRRTLIIAMLIATSAAFALDPLSFGSIFEAAHVVRFAAAYGMAWLWWYFLPLPDDFPEIERSRNA